MKRTLQNQSEDAGSDSFLDIVSNIVGILIILVMLVGSRVTDLVVSNETENQPAAAAPADDLAELERSTVALVNEVGSLLAESRKLDLRTVSADQNTLELGTLIRTEARKMQLRRERMDTQSRQTDLLAQRLVEEKTTLNSLRKSQISLASQVTPVVRIQSYPTPISKTVFGREEHYRLRGGRVVRIPFQELIDELMGEKRQVLWNLKDLPEVTGAVGPIDGFKLQYHLVRTHGGAALTKGIYVPATTKLGEPLAQALAPNSAFRLQLMRLDRVKTTITVWTYPDSFSEFRTLKKELYTLGFTVAARPLGNKDPIGISPRGTRSSAQ